MRPRDLVAAVNDLRSGANTRYTLHLFKTSNAPEPTDLVGLGGAYRGVHRTVKKRIKGYGYVDTCTVVVSCRPLDYTDDHGNQVYESEYSRKHFAFIEETHPFGGPSVAKFIDPIVANRRLSTYKKG